MDGREPETPVAVEERAARSAAAPDVLRGFWYVALPGAKLKRGRMVHKRLLGERLLIGRDSAGKVFALRDVCPHRAMPLSAGQFDGREVTCPYHGWRFGTDGGCRAIPSLTADQKLNLERIRTGAYPCREVQHVVWVFMAEAGESPAPEDPDLPPISEIGALGDRKPHIVSSSPIACQIDDAVIGLIDPAHGPYVHKNWWWRSSKTLKDKEKRFAPIDGGPADQGFVMVRHTPSSNSRIFRMLGGEMSVEISFRLPGVRVEHITMGGKHHYVGLTAMTPLDDHLCEMHHIMYWTHPLMTALKPVLVPVTHNFLSQDRRAMAAQGEVTREAQPTMLVPDADTPARWYLALKREVAAARREGRRVKNPVPEDAVLRYRT